MLTSRTKRAMAAGLAMTMLGAGLLGGSASADPENQTAFVGVGSDTTQDIMNALSGRSNNLLYTPMQSSAGTGSTQEISYDATNPVNGSTDRCITTKRGYGAMLRPNGSTEGRQALSATLVVDAIGDPAPLLFGLAAKCGGPKDVSGMVDFARSSSGPTGTSNGLLTYIPFAKDAMSFAYYKPTAGAAVTTLTQAELLLIFGSATRQVIGGVTIIPCGIQLGSGTFKFWNKAVTGNEVSATEATATAQCNAAGLASSPATAGRAQESDGPALSLRGDLLNSATSYSGQPALGGTNFQVVIGFSAGSFISKSNGVATPHPGAGVDQIFGGANAADDKSVLIGDITGLGSPITGSAPTMAPSITFFGSSTFGRSIYNVFSTTRLAGLGDADLKNLFVGSGSVICSSTFAPTIQKFGFLPSATCGIGQLGDLVTGNPSS